MHLALLGGGRMGEALAVGLVESGWEPDSLAIGEIDGDRRHALEGRLPGVRVAPTPAWAAADAEVVVVAVKPADAVDALESCLEALREGALVLSVAAGVTLATLEAAAPGHPVVRAMPNTGALVGRGAAAIAAGAVATGLGARVPLPGRRGDDRGRRAGGTPPRDQRSAGAPDVARRRRTAR